MMGVVEISFDEAKKNLVLEWESSPENDMWADAVVMVAMDLEGNPQAIRSMFAEGFSFWSEPPNLGS